MRIYHIEYMIGRDWRENVSKEADDHIFGNTGLTLLLEGEPIAVFDRVLTWHFTEKLEQLDPSGL